MDQIERPWSPEEDEMLLNIVEKCGLIEWSLIINSIPGKSAETCWSRWLSLAKKDMDQIERQWSPEEDEMLEYLVEKYGRNWSQISKSTPGRSAKTCWSRWLSLVKQEMDQIERQWSPEEDEMLEYLVEKHGRNWSRISKSIPSKSAKSCWSRWLSLQWSFTTEEDEMLQNLAEKHGPNWSLISKSIPGRSAKTCELRWETVWNPLQIHEDIENHRNSTLKWKSSSMTNEDIAIVSLMNLTKTGNLDE